MKFRIFISSVQREFARERRQLAEYIRKDLVFSKFFDVFLFEEIPAGDASPKAVYMKEVARSDIYLGLIGREYGFEDDAGVSPTEREYDCAGEHNKPRFVFVKKSDVRAPKEQRFLEKVESERVRKTFPNLKSLKDAVAATLIRFLEERRKIQTGPFDSATEETRTEITQKATQKTAVGSYEGSYERSYEILELIKSNPRILAKEIAAKKSISWRAVMKHIAHLKKDGRLRRIGPRKGGHWEVIGEVAK